MVALRIERVCYGHPDAARLIDEVQAAYAALYGTPDEGAIDRLMFEPPHGSFYVGYSGDVPIATGAWRRLDVEAFGTSATAEIKRMYVAPDARGRGHARRILHHLEATAGAGGAEAMILETGLRQPEAIALYESAGYTPITAFGHYRDSPICRCFGKLLVAGESAG